jgi:class 3 adenylate cyclase
MPFPLPNLPLPNLPRFGELLREYRTLRGMTVDEVAQTAGLVPNALRDMESGKRAAPGKSVVTTLADTLDLDKEERSLLREAAELDTPLMRAVMGQPKSTTAGPPSMTAAILVFLIADIRGYTHFTQDQGDEAAAALTTRFAELARGVAEERDGHLLEARGDEILAIFASARQALLAARELHERYDQEAQARPDWPLGIGIGLDVGEAAPVDEGYRGVALNRAARLCSLAGPGEVLVSTGMVYLAPHVEGITFQARGQVQLKGLDGPTPVLLAAPSRVVEAEGAAADEPAGE